jgi:hypothetical protein
MSLQELLMEGTKGLPEEALKEILEFAFFVRKKTLYPQAFEDELYSELLDKELGDMARHETTHLEDEFKNYDKTYPNE